MHTYPTPQRTEDYPTDAEVRAMESPEPMLLRDVATTIARPRGVLSCDTLSVKLGVLALECARSHPHIADHLHELSKLVGVDLFLADRATSSFVQTGTVHDERTERTAREAEFDALRAGIAAASEQVTSALFAAEDAEFAAIFGEMGHGDEDAIAADQAHAAAERSAA